MKRGITKHCRFLTKEMGLYLKVRIYAKRRYHECAYDFILGWKNAFFLVRKWGLCMQFGLKTKSVRIRNSAKIIPKRSIETDAIYFPRIYHFCKQLKYKFIKWHSLFAFGVVDNQIHLSKTAITYNEFRKYLKNQILSTARDTLTKIQKNQSYLLVAFFR